MTVHYVVARWSEDREIIIYVAACGVEDPTAHHWTVNRDLVTCYRCKQRA